MSSILLRSLYSGPSEAGMVRVVEKMDAVMTGTMCFGERMCA